MLKPFGPPARARIAAGVFAGLSVGVAVACGAQTAEEPKVPVAPVASAEPSASAPKKPRSRPATDEELAQVRQMFRRVEAARGLRKKKPIVTEVMDREQILRAVEEQVERDLPKGELELEEATAKALDMVPASYDFKQGIYKLLQSEIAGFYDPKRGSMVLAADLAGSATLEITLAHELVHALQDQYFDLASKMKFREGQSDQLMVSKLLAEGGATSGMFEIAMADMPTKPLDNPDRVILNLLRDGMEGGGKDTPAYLTRSLVAPYADGLVFIHALRRKGGWAEVNKAWKSPPASTEQMLHPARYFAHEAPLTLRPVAPKKFGAAMKQLTHDRVGELGLRDLLAEWVSLKQAEKAAEGWGGDRLQIVGEPGKQGKRYLHWEMAFDQDRSGACPDVAEAFAAFETQLGKRSQPASKPAFACLERKAFGALSVKRKGCSLHLQAGPWLGSSTVGKNIRPKSCGDHRKRSF